MANGQIRISLIQYDKDVKIIKSFTDDFVVDFIKKYVNEMKLSRSGANANGVLKVSASDVFPKSRDNVRKVLVLFTDVVDNQDEIALKRNVEKLAKQGVMVVAFGAGGRVKLSTLINIATTTDDVIVADTSKTFLYYYYMLYERILASK